MNQSHFTYEADGHTLIVHLPEELDHHNCSGLKYETDLILSENYIRRIIFDFSSTRFMDSSGIGLVMGRYKLMNTFGGAVTVANTPKPLQKVMRLAGLDRLARIKTEE